MLEIIPKNTNIDFVGKRHFWFAISAIAVAASITLFLTKGLNYGIDFTGGAEVQLRFKKQFTIGELRKTVEDAGFKNVSIQELSDSAAAAEARGGTFRVKFRGDEAELQKIATKFETTLTAKMPAADFEMLGVDVVGPQAGSQLRKSGFLSMFYALLCILIYVAIRFDYRYSPGAVLALFHDSIITMGIFVLTQKEFSLQIVAAILTIIGYSNNDTIIVFDRVRETIKLHPNLSIEENVNRSINETLSRTILTSLATMLVVLALMIFGGGVIEDFAFAMLIGIIVGTYSSIFIASPVMIMLSKRMDRRAAAEAKKLRLQAVPSGKDYRA
ncbi:MAG: protein translocase subunit SecF [Deltaproteobacteria bacterium]|nr:protein translocase subunit SecF [Deltaproteobacteria bacterium]